MKRLIPSLTLIILIGLVACGQGNDTKHSSATTPAPNEQTPIKDTLKQPTLTKDEAYLLKIASKLCKKGKFRDGIKIFDSIIAINPNSAYAYAGRSGAWFTLGDLIKAKDDCERSLALDPNNTFALYNRGQILGYYHNYDKAIADYDRAIKINPQYASAYSARAVAEVNIGKIDAAKRDFAKAIEIAPFDPSTYYNRGVMWGLIGQPDSEMLDYRMALKILPRYEEPQLNMGVVRLKNRKDYKGAINDFTLVININPKNTKAWYLRAKAKTAIKDYKGAIADLNQAIVLNPQYKNAYLQRSEVYALMGDKAKAAKDAATANSMK